MSKPFHFKEFSVEQDRCAMKVGTDGVLLGAWVSLKNDPQSVLDVGTGTGVIALMLAQRSDAAQIDALEIEEDAYEQAVENFENSDWGDRLFCYHADFEEFVEEMREEEKYDLIVSNPPFYAEDYSSSDPKRDQARFSEALPFDQLLQGVSELLSEKGRFSVVVPRKEEERFIELTRGIGLFPQRITRVKGNPESEEKRSLMELGFQQTKTEVEILIIENSRHDYTEGYIQLVKDFYLKM